MLGALAAATEDGVVGPELSGQVTVEMDDGSTVEMDAAEYMAELKQEAQALRVDYTKRLAAERVADYRRKGAASVASIQ